MLYFSMRNSATLRFYFANISINSVLRPFNHRGTERTEDYGKIVGFLRQAHEPTENSDEPQKGFRIMPIACDVLTPSSSSLWLSLKGGSYCEHIADMKDRRNA